jgi:hypothetical protein
MRFREARLDSWAAMKARACLFVSLALLLPASPASSIAAERARLDSMTGLPRTRSAPTTTAGDDSKAIDKLIRDINAAAREDKRRMLSIIIINTNVAGTTLEQQKARTGLSFGDIYVAHALSLATRKKFDTIVAMKARGQSWSQIARAHNVSLKGSTALLKEMMKQ